MKKPEIVTLSGPQFGPQRVRALGEPIKVRLSPEKHAHFEDEAAQLDKPLATYLRERLEAPDTVGAKVSELRREVVSLHQAVADLADGGLEAGERMCARRR